MGFGAEDDYYKQVGGDALVGNKRQARKASEAEAAEAADSKKRKKSKKKGGGRAAKSAKTSSDSSAAAAAGSSGQQYSKAEFAVRRPSNPHPQSSSALSLRYMFDPFF